MASKMKDVAERAGVSVTTVSHVLNKTRFVAPETEARIHAVIRELNYYKNAHARRLACGQSDLFGLIISEIANPFFPEIIKGFQSAAWEKGFDMLLLNTEYDPKRLESAVRQMIESEVRGVAVMTSAFNDAATKELTLYGLGVVFYNCGPPQKLVSNIKLDYSKGISQAISYITGLGHQRIAVIGGPRKNRVAATLQNAIVEALLRRNIQPWHILESDYKVDGGVSAVATLLKRSVLPTAIFCGNDLIAMGAMSALEDCGIRVPDDVSVIGFDDIFFARLARPPLTTIHIPRDQLGKLAFEALDKLARSKRPKGIEYLIETSFVIRKSTAAPRTHALSVSPANTVISKPSLKPVSPETDSQFDGTISRGKNIESV
ncbi:MAG: LacI family transcriptional regulator [Acidobacteria bacterium]|nr:LacI family transcriptional regulator [Acidobacteriota bacterium]MCI0721954.1 LacI family transcriptional regulator [Acidobacteriota bacterium]